MKSRPASSSARLIEPLEARIAPALSGVFSPAVINTAILLDSDPTTPAPQGLSAAQDGAYMLYVEKGSALVFTKDLNLNQKVDFNEITGIAAGPNLSLISFVDIHGDIVTNLNPDGTLTDSDNDAANGRDGRVLLANRIDKIEMRSVTTDDLPAGEPVSDRIALSSYSIFGNIYAGGGFGTPDGKGGLIIDDAGRSDQGTEFNGGTGYTLYQDAEIQIGSIRVGTAASGQQFGFGASPEGGVASLAPKADVRGILQDFIQPPNTAGADINGIHATSTGTLFNINTLQAGDGGFNGRGGNISNVQITGDFSGGYALIAGNAGDGPTGPAGGSILNYSDLGSIAGGQIFLKTGDGGNGLLKRGGNGGNLTLDPAAPINFAGHVVIKLGDGGDGVTGGGNGGAQLGGSFTTPETTVPFGLSIVSTWHQPGDIYNQRTTDDFGIPLVNGNFGYHATRGFDFNLDGINDAVYSTEQSDQLVVVFGDGTGGFTALSNNIYLNNLPGAQAVTIGDFNDDGHPDIAAAAGNQSFAGVQVFLSLYDKNDPNKFVGFRDPIYSPLPSVGGLFIKGGGSISNTRQQQTSAEAYDMASGDFDNDGTVDLAVITDLGLFMLKGDAQSEPDPNGGAPVVKATGYFYSDAGANGVDGLGLPRIPASPHVNQRLSTLHASALADGGRDFLFAADEGETGGGGPPGFVSLMDDLGGNFVGTPISIRTVDTNRAYPGPGTNITTTPATPRDFIVLDSNNDGNADLAMLTLAPQGFLVTFEGDGAGAFTPTSNRETGGQNDGLYIGDVTPGPYDRGGLDRTALIGLMAANTDGDANGRANDIALMVYDTHGAGIRVQEFNFGVETNNGGPVPIPTDVNYKAVFPTGNAGLVLRQGDSTIRAFDTYLPNPGTPTASTYSYLQAFKDDRTVDFIETPFINGAGGYVDDLEDNVFYVTAGHGGNASNGSGGSGGQLGNILKIDQTTGQPVGSLSFMFPSEPAYEGLVRFIAGNGGDGFTAGGAAGNFKGVMVGYPTATGVQTGDVLIFAGDGGDSSNGRAGRGGDLSSFAIESGFYFSAGDGGHGKYGGNGGNVLGNPGSLVDVTVTPGVGGKGDIENTRSAFLVVKSGVGGDGTRGGGDGGNISGFTPRFLPLIGGSGGLLYYEAGDGGASVGGRGGKGGSIVDSSPVTEDNNLDGDIYVIAGDGGLGKIGGAGGGIQNFKNSSAPDISPTSLTFLGGNGGLGIGGAGGAGGTINTVVVSGTGAGFQYYFDFSDPEHVFTINDAFVGLAQLTYARIAAGNGGTSLGAGGGAGGAITTVTATASSTPMVGIAGRGGDGMTTGGAGGSVLSTTLNAAGPIGKVLVAAGDGGDGLGAPPIPGDPLAFGGKNARGGLGGSITGFTQSIGTEVNVDLIAGNGGNTPNIGSTQAAKTTVGNGGSITNAQIIGSIGTGETTADEFVAIKSYNDLLGGETFAAFVAANITADPGVGGVLPIIDDTVGNVGIVVGAKGRVKDNNHDGVLDPSTFGSNGSLTNVHARNIMSAVAGSVERIASIRTLSNVGVTIVGGNYGADKQIDYLGRLGAPGNAVGYHDSDLPSALDYLDPVVPGHPADDLWVKTPMLGGILVDGAILADTVRTAKSVRDF